MPGIRKEASGAWKCGTGGLTQVRRLSLEGAFTGYFIQIFLVGGTRLSEKCSLDQASGRAGAHAIEFHRDRQPIMEPAYQRNILKVLLSSSV